MARARRPTSKAGRNEGRKLLGAFLNNVGPALFLAAWLQPAIAALRQHLPFTWTDGWGSFLLFIIGLMFVAGAQAVARRQED